MGMSTKASPRFAHTSDSPKGRAETMGTAIRGKTATIFSNKKITKKGKKFPLA